VQLAQPTPQTPGRIDANASALQFLDEHLKRLRELPAHGNRILQYDQLLIALLLSFFDPTVRSLRLIEHCGNFRGRIDLDRLAKSTTADALAAFDPVYLQPIIADLQRRAGQLRKKGEGLLGICRRIIAADGTYLTTLADVAWALKHHRSDGRIQAQVRLNVQLDVESWTPEVISVSGDDGSEPAAFAKDLRSDVLYVLDRNFVDFPFLGALLEKHNHFVLRIRSNAPAMSVVEKLPLGAADIEAGVHSDQIVTLDGTDAPAGQFRLVVIHTTDRDGKLQIIRLLSDLIDGKLTSAKLLGEIYQQRWQIELFFKWLKTWANLDHLLSTSRSGITFQFYVAVIAVLLMYLQMGRRVSRYAIFLLGRLCNGQITMAQMMSSLEKLEREKARARERAAQRRAEKKKTQPAR
jgi:hypothetical protein